MVHTTITLLVLLITFIILGIGYKSKQWNFVISGFVLLSILGILMFASPLQYKAGESVTENYTYQPNSTQIDLVEKTVTYDYQSDQSVLSYTLAMIFVLLGIFGILDASDRKENDKYAKEEQF